jgi:hypothetical protein
MKTQKIPQTDSIEELARFWNTHDLTDFGDELEEVAETAFEREPGTMIHVHFQSDQVEEIERIARSQGLGRVDLIREWVVEKLHASGA